MKEDAIQNFGVIGGNNDEEKINFVNLYYSNWEHFLLYCLF